MGGLTTFSAACGCTLYAINFFRTGHQLKMVAPNKNKSFRSVLQLTVAAVREFLVSKGWSGEILEFADSSATVELAAQKVGTEPSRIAKTLGFYDPADPAKAILVVAAGDAKVNGGKFKRTFGGKPRMLQHEDVAPLTGYPVGGVCPFANAPGARVFLDDSLKRFESVFPAAGTASSAVNIMITELAKLSDAEGWVDVTVVPVSASTADPQ